MKEQKFKGKYVANCDMPIKYTFQLGGGINGRTIRKGDVITAVCSVSDINGTSIATVETLHRINAEHFKDNFSQVN